MAQGRGPSTLGILGFLLLVGPLAFSAWWFTRPAPVEPPPGPPIDQLDIVCTGRVDAEGLVVPLDPSLPGRVVRVSVVEGQTVKKDQEILATDDSAFKLGAKAAKIGVDAAQVELDFAELRAKQFPATLAVKRKQLAAMTADTAANEAKVAQMREQAKQTTSVSNEDIDLAQAAIERARLFADAAKIEIDELKNFDAQLEVRAAKAKHDAAVVEHQRAEKAVADCVLTAPAAGTILRLAASAGGTVAPGSPVPAVVFAPAGPLIVRAELEQQHLGRVAEGRRAIIRDDARIDSPEWAGRVKRVGEYVSMKRSILLEPGEMNDVRTVEVVIALDPSPHALLIGQRMQVRLVAAK